VTTSVSVHRACLLIRLYKRDRLIVVGSTTSCDLHAVALNKTSHCYWLAMISMASQADDGLFDEALSYYRLNSGITVMFFIYFSNYL